MDKVEDSKISKISIKIGEFFKTFSVEKNIGIETWSRFRGDNFDNISKSKVALISKFPENGPEVLWKKELGEGHAGAAIFKGIAYVLDYDETENADMLRSFNLKTGAEIWRRWYKVKIKRNHGISRTVPAVSEEYVLSIGPKCHVMCVDRKTGKFLWGKDIANEYESEIPLWYTGQCPIIDNGIALIATGGKSLMVAIDCKTGETVWETPNPDNWKMSHASIIKYSFMGAEMYVYPSIGGIVGISASEENIGKILWKSTKWNHNVISPSPVCMPDGKIFLTAGYGAGSMMIQIKKDGDSFTTIVIDEYKPKAGLACEQQTPVYWQNHLFGILPKDAGTKRNQLICVKPENCKKSVWESGKTNRFGLGPYLIADNKIWLLEDNGTLFIIEANPYKYNLLDSYKVLDGHDAWAPIAIADGYMVLRDSKTMICLNLNSSDYE